MEITQKNGISNLSPEKLKEVKVHWTLLNQPSQKAIENFNRVLANAQLRGYREGLETK